MSTVLVSDQFNFRVEQSSPREFIFTITNPDGSLQNLTGIVFEFVAQTQAGAQICKILSTDVSNPAGSIVVNTVASTVDLKLSATATALIVGSTPVSDQYCLWALWENPGQASQNAILSGQIYTRAVAQP